MNSFEKTGTGVPKTLLGKCKEERAPSGFFGGQSSDPGALNPKSTLKSDFSNPYESEIFLCAKKNTRMGPRAARELAQREAKLAALNLELEAEDRRKDSEIVYETEATSRFGGHAPGVTDNNFFELKCDTDRRASPSYVTDQVISTWGISSRWPKKNNRDYDVEPTVRLVDDAVAAGLSPRLRLCQSQLKSLKHMKERIVRDFSVLGDQSVPSINSLFQRLNLNMSGSVECVDFRERMRAAGIPFTESDVAIAIQALSSVGDGRISCEKFANLIRGGALPPNRCKVATCAFEIADSDGKGFVTADDMRRVYDFSSHAHVRDKCKHETEEFAEFISIFFANGDGQQLTRDNFIEASRNISCLCAQDVEFEELVLSFIQF